MTVQEKIESRECAYKCIITLIPNLLNLREKQVLRIEPKYGRNPLKVVITKRERDIIILRLRQKTIAEGRYRNNPMMRVLIHPNFQNALTISYENEIEGFYEECILFDRYGHVENKIEQSIIEYNRILIEWLDGLIEKGFKEVPLKYF